MVPMPDVANETPPIERLREVMRRLRDPQSGCPWDVEQSFATIAPYTIEEAYEVAEAIQTGDMDALKDELGDLLLQVVFHAQMADEDKQFDFDAVATAIADKMIRRHPHVFGDVAIDGAAAPQRQVRAPLPPRRGPARGRRPAPRGGRARGHGALVGASQARGARRRLVQSRARRQRADDLRRFAGVGMDMIADHLEGDFAQVALERLVELLELGPQHLVGEAARDAEHHGGV